MAIRTSVKIGRVGNSILADIDPSTVKMLADEMAATILHEAVKLPIDGNLMTDPPERVGKELASRIHHWASHGYINALLTEVEFVYAYVKFLVDNGQPLIWPERQELQLYADALSAFQAWKIKQIAAEKAVHGDGWGSSTEFNNSDWTDLNGLLLDSSRR